MNGLVISGKAVTRVPNRWLANVPSQGGDNICGAALDERTKPIIRFGVRQKPAPSWENKRKVV